MSDHSTVKTWNELAAFSGSEASHAISGQERREVFWVNYDQMKANYNGGVDFQLRARSTLLCPQTADFLYRHFTPTTTDYRVGSRPVLEQAVRQTINILQTDRDKVLALMRFCRDLYKKHPHPDVTHPDYVFGGTEEQLIEKGEELCECLERLFAALCEIAGFPARWVIHIIGGHIVSEVYLEGKWVYMDPRAGLYFLRPDGKPASTWELWHNPAILRQQPEHVKADVSERWTWHERVWRCENLFFHPDEITAIANYKLADASQYNYAQVSQSLTTKLGMWEHNKRYTLLTNKIFGLTDDGYNLKWGRHPLRKTSLIYRNDGFSPFFYHKPPMSPEQMCKEFIDPLANTNVDILEWGMGPGSVLCYDTQVGDICGANLTDQQRAMLCEGDNHVYRNVTGMIANGVDPLFAAINRGHELGLKVYTRLEMNHEYSPASDDNWMWVGLVGSFNKKNPQYRIPGHVNLDFKHPEVRQFKLGILREAAQRGSDCISMDFAVYPPFFEHPDAAIMTQFIRDVRHMADELGASQNRRIELMVRFPAAAAMELGLDWASWMRQRLVHAAVPSFGTYGTEFDIDIDRFVAMGHRTGVKVYGCIFQSLGFYDTDETPDDEKIGRKYDKAKTREVYYAQAMLYHRAGADGIQLAMAEAEWNRNPFFDDLADPQKMLYKNKRYMANLSVPNQPVMTLSPSCPHQSVSIRIADDLKDAILQGHQPKTHILLYANRYLSPDERIELSVNGKCKACFTADSRSWALPVPPKADVFDPDWWRAGEHTLSIDPESLDLGENELIFSYDSRSTDGMNKFAVRWIDLKVMYE